MDGGAWKAAVNGVAKGRTRLSDFPFTFHFHALEKANGNPLQCSCLENPRDGGAWWAAVYGVARSRTRLKWLSRSSSRVNLSGVSTASAIILCLQGIEVYLLHLLHRLHILQYFTLCSDPFCSISSSTAETWKHPKFKSSLISWIWQIQNSFL